MTDAAPKRIWADQENLTWVEECPGEAMMDYEAEYILASEVAALIREAEARGMERAAELALSCGIAVNANQRDAIAAAIRAAKATP